MTAAANSDAAKRIAERTDRHHIHPDPEVRALVAREVAAAEVRVLREAARDFRASATHAWGGDTTWITTGSKVADLAAAWLEGMATEKEQS